MIKKDKVVGIVGAVMSKAALAGPPLAQAAGIPIEGGCLTNHFSKDDPRPEVQAFVAKHKARFDSNPDALAALKASELDAVTGRIGFDEERNPIKSAVIIELKVGGRSSRRRCIPSRGGSLCVVFVNGATKGRVSRIFSS